MKVKGICYFVLSQYSVLVGLNIHAVNRPQGAYYLYPFEDPCSTLFCNNVYWCRLVWSGNVCGIQTMNELQCPLDETAAVKIYIQAYLFFVATWWGKQ